VVEGEGGVIERVENACRKGASFIYASNKRELRNGYLVEGKRVSLEEALDRACELISQSKNLMIFGLDNSTLEAQARAIELARKVGGCIDDCSSFCQGDLVEAILAGRLSSCQFPQLQEADLIVYWGANPYHSHPRHLSRFVLYPYERTKPATLCCVEVRDTELTGRCKYFFKLLPGGDREFIHSLLAALEGKPAGEEVGRLVELIKKARFLVIFVGLGLIYSLDNDLSLLCQLSEAIKNRASTDVAFMPMACHTNMRGFNRLLYEETGYVNRVSFQEQVPRHGGQFSLLGQLYQSLVDCLLLVGTDPFSSLPASLMRNLNRKGVKVITLDPYITSTTKNSQVVFGTAISGIETGGKAIRMDGTEVELSPLRPNPGYLSDQEILSQILARL